MIRKERESWLHLSERTKQLEVFPVMEVLLQELCHFNFSSALCGALHFANSYLFSPMPQATGLEHSPVPILVITEKGKEIMS